MFEQTRVSDGVDIVSKDFRMSIRQAATEKGYTAGSLTMSVWRRDPYKPASDAIEREAATAVSNLYVGFGGLIVDNGELVINELVGYPATHNEKLRINPPQGMDEPLLNTLDDVVTTSFSSWFVLREFSKDAHRPTAREIEAVRLMMSRYVIDRAAGEELVDLADADGRLYFKPETDLYEILTARPIILPAIEFAHATVAEKLKEAARRYGIGSNGETLQ
ncbi:hypothetical protein [Silvimonas soli]|uniref:hypothetical protein n=1 Tax=Silvimonas soli TaxID=2980100 RepID=UPI0024B357A5|nr:hypothetical protein [Silvimonas soli]